jgi:hypothetical protein
MSHIVIYFHMQKKTSFISIRTTEGNEKFLKEMAEQDDRTVSSTISKMIRYFRNKGSVKKAIKELNK